MVKRGAQSTPFRELLLPRKGQVVLSRFSCYGASMKIPLHQSHQAEVKLLTAIYADEVFEGNLVHQEKPVCCDRLLDLYKNPVRFEEVQVGSNKTNLISVRCPHCHRWAVPVYRLVM